MKKHKNYVSILASGGIDSTACINFYKKLKFEVEAVFIDYGQSSIKNELKSIKLITQYYKINLSKIGIRNGNKYGSGTILGRNAFLFFMALMNFTRDKGTIASGIHLGTNYYDCSENFIESISDIFNKYSQGTIAVGTPFLNFYKNEIIDYCIIEKVPLDLTYSCELGRKQPCGICNTCKEIQLIYASKNF